MLNSYVALYLLADSIRIAVTNFRTRICDIVYEFFEYRNIDTRSLKAVSNFTSIYSRIIFNKKIFSSYLFS